MDAAIADIVVALEHDLADFYAGLMVRSRFSELKAIFQLMERQSRRHAKRVEGISRMYAVPGGFDVTAIEAVQDKIKRVLHDEIMRTSDIATVCQKLADGEESLSLLYRRIAEHFRSLAADHRPLAAEFDRLADEELLHRNSILQERDKYRHQPAKE